MSLLFEPHKSRQGDPFYSWLGKTQSGVRQSPSGRRVEAQLLSYPACFYEATLTDELGISKKLETGSGNEIGHHLEALCLAFLAGQLDLATEDDAGAQVFAYKAKTDGHDTIGSSLPGGLTLVSLEERDSFQGRVPEQSLVFHDRKLAKATAKHASEGMLAVARAKSKVPVVSNAAA